MTLFIADENIPMPSVRKLREAGLDILSIRETFASMDDIGIIQVASDENRVIITCDSDFGELLFFRRVICRASVIFLRLGDITKLEPAEFVLAYIESSPDIFNGKFSVITRDRIRQRPV